MARTRYLLPVIFHLGVANVLTVVLYRLFLKSGLAAHCMPVGQAYESRFFPECVPSQKVTDKRFSEEAIIRTANKLLDGWYAYFSYHERKVGVPPRWFANPFDNSLARKPHQHWSRLDDFVTGVGDIKLIWDLSRFSWTLDLAKAYMVSRDDKYLCCLNDWISSWTQKNPMNTGPNWKCGQETGIRLLHVLLTTYLLRQHLTPCTDLQKFVAEHCQRIEPTIYYALAQNNNHGTSEAAALFVGGAWLAKSTSDNDMAKKAKRWEKKGRHLLENRIRHLVSAEGTFSQYSVVYHRMLVDTLNIVEFWRRELNLNTFSDHYYVKARAAVDWLRYVIDPVTGDAPNLGANDGTSLFKLHSSSYRDFRPTVQLGAALFFNTGVYPPGPWDEPKLWLGIHDISTPTLRNDLTTRQFKNGGYVVFRNSNGNNDFSWGLLRFPSFRFRPNHADGFHLDLWHCGVNLLRDSGSYSYNTEKPWNNYFSSTCSHNTIELDGRDQMPRVGRFLRGAWLTMDSLDGLKEKAGEISWSGSYKDYKGGQHRRTVVWAEDCWLITDQVDGAESTVVLRWRLAPGSWQLKDNHCIGKLAELTVESSSSILSSEIVEGWESRYYWQKAALPVWEIKVDANSTVFTTYVSLK